jgi:hypothetical protein
MEIRLMIGSKDYGKLKSAEINFSYGVRHLTRGSHFSIIKISEKSVILQKTINRPQIDCNGEITFESAIWKVARSYFNNEFKALTREEFCKIFYFDEDDLKGLNSDAN